MSRNMIKIITNQEHQINAKLEVDDEVTVTINGEVVTEHKVSEGNRGLVTFMYQEQEIVIE